MESGIRVLISAATQTAFRDLARDIVTRDINSIWRDEGFAPSPDTNLEISGERRRLYQSYLACVNWSDPGHVDRALRAFEKTIEACDGGLGDARIVRSLERDGYRLKTFGDEGSIRISRVADSDLSDGTLSALPDAGAIREGLDRIARAIEAGDHAQAIGSAKELIESTAKLVLHEVGLPPSERDDLPKLVRQTQEALHLHPSQQRQPGVPDATTAVNKILGGATGITLGLAELRNRGYGTGHGQSDTRVGLHARHARMAVSGARLWCEFVLDTLNDPEAPWKQQQTLGS